MAFQLDTFRELAQVTTYQDQALDVMRWGRNNAFPQTLKNVIDQSPSAKPSVERTIRFLRGRSFDGENTVVNPIGTTLSDVVDFCAREYAYFGGFSLQTNWNIAGGVSSIYPLSLTDLRFQSLDELNYSVKIGYHPNFGLNSKIRKTISNTPTRGKIKWFDRFNPGYVGEQIEKVGEISKYNGQILYVSNEGHSEYPIPWLQPSINYVLSDVENSILVRKETSTGFINSYILKSTLSNEDPNLQALEKSIQEVQGARGSGKVITFAGLSEAEVQGTLLEAIAGGAGTAGTIIDAATKTFKLDRDVILGTYLIPPILGGADQSTGFTSDELKDAYFVFNANTQSGRDLIQNNINRILRESDFGVKEIQLRKLKLDEDEELDSGEEKEGGDNV
jgi:hypothetical protein